MNQNQAGEAICFGIITLIFIAAMLSRRKLRLSTTAMGTAHWMNKAMLRAYGMLGDVGLVLARCADGTLIRLKDYVHTLLIGAPGSGKSAGIMFPNLLTYRSSVVCNDPKTELAQGTRKAREKMGQRVVVFGPCVPNTDKINPLDAISRDSPLLVDDARAMAESLVVRNHGGAEVDPHWGDKAVQVITALLTLILLTFDQEERNLNSVQDIASDPMMLLAAADKLIALGGVPERMGHQIQALFGDG